MSEKLTVEQVEAWRARFIDRFGDMSVDGMTPEESQIEDLCDLALSALREEESGRQLPVPAMAGSDPQPTTTDRPDLRALVDSLDATYAKANISDDFPLGQGEHAIKLRALLALAWPTIRAALRAKEKP